MSQTDTTKRPVAAGADHMQNTMPAGEPYTTATLDTFGQSQAAAGGSVNKSTQNKPSHKAASPDNMGANDTEGEEEGSMYLWRWRWRWRHGWGCAKICNTGQIRTKTVSILVTGSRKTLF